MGLFQKEPPKACPKCGKADGWRCMPDDTPQSNAADAGMGNPFYLDSQRDPMFNSMGGYAPKTSYRYCCDNCGYEKTYRV